MSLKGLLEDYKRISLELIEEIKKEVNTECLMRERQDILNKIVESNLSKEEKMRIGKEINILEIEKDVKQALEEEQRNVKEEIREMHIKRQANSGYGKNINSIIFFNARV